jgi:WD40 repeat protein
MCIGLTITRLPVSSFVLFIATTLFLTSGPLFAVNDVCVHPNQGELISCDQAGRIKQWDLSENICSHELVGAFPTFVSLALCHQTPAGDIPIRSVTLASDGSLLVAGNNKVKLPSIQQCFRLDLALGKMLCVESERGGLKPAKVPSSHQVSSARKILDSVSS